MLIVDMTLPDLFCQSHVLIIPYFQKTYLFNCAYVLAKL